MKKVITFRIEETSINFIEHVSKLTNLPKGSAIDLISELVSIYFTDEQLILEAQALKKADGRTTRWQKRAEEVIVY
jgi:hypothetical protein